ncbi:MAG: L,D-transpeptidase family protein [Solirubrobacterales bacterium]|nr:L,D-transpeptidase family protein [Solirubrobacterales bacterium]
MSARRITFACAVSIAVSAPAAALAATPKQAPATPPPQARIAPGIGAGGVDLSNLTVTEAAARLHGALDAHLARPVALEVRGRVFRLTMPTAKFAMDAEKTAQNALATPAPGAGGSAAQANLPLVVTHSTTAVRTFVASVAKQVASDPRDATLRITVRHMVVRRSAYGYRLDQVATYKLVNAALADAAAERKLRKPLTKIRAAVNTNDLAKQYATVITIQKSTRTLRLFKSLKISKRYSVAIGQPAYPTPEGRFSIQSKQTNPTWSVPNSPWAGELGGTTVQGGTAANPLKARWMGIVNGVGIHGTGDDASIGTAASHGCLRMHVSDVIDLYERVPVGTPVLIAA